MCSSAATSSGNSRPDSARRCRSRSSSKIDISYFAATQAVRASRSVSQAVAQGADEGDRDVAFDELRTYMLMLMVGAPVLIDAKVSRSFLEQAQAVGGLMAHALGVMARSSGPAAPSDGRLDQAVQRLRAASTPLLAVLDPETQAAVRGDESALRVRKWSHLGKGRR